MKDSCMGPCLPHCCKNIRIQFFILGALFGIILSIMYNYKYKYTQKLCNEVK